jgi:hypothetical protein
MNTEPLKVGDCLTATLRKSAGDNAWEAHSDSAPNWRILLKNHPKHGWTREWKSGDEAEFRVFRIDPAKKELTLTDSKRGFLPISVTMRIRYLIAIRGMLELCATEKPEIADQTKLKDAISDLKGAVKRCILKNQPDWFDVYSGLGKPDVRDLKNIETQLRKLHSFVKTGSREEMLLALAELRKLGFNAMLERLDKHIDSTYVGLNSDGSRKKFEQAETPPTHCAIGPYQISVDKQKLDWANDEHKRTLYILSKALDNIGYIVEINRSIDAFTRLKSGPAIFEVKSITEENELGQARAALAQLYEYRYRHNYPGASLWLVFSMKPSTDWLVEYLAGDRDINVLWVESGQLAGPSLHLLNKSTSRGPIASRGV